MAWFVNLTRGVPDAARDRLLRRRLHDAAQALDAAEHRHRRRRRGAAAGHRLGRGHRQRRASRRCSCSRSSSTGRRRISGRSRCGSARTTPRPACRCSPSSRASPRRPARSRLYTVLMVAISLVLCSPSRRMGADLPRRGGRPRRDLPVAGVRPVAPRRVRGGLDGRRDPPLQVLDQLPEPAVPRGRGRRAGADPGLSAPSRPPQVGQQRLGGQRPAEEAPAGLRAAATARPRTVHRPRTGTSPGRPRTTDRGPRGSAPGPRPP